MYAYVGPRHAAIVTKLKNDQCMPVYIQYAPGVVPPRSSSVRQLPREHLVISPHIRNASWSVFANSLEGTRTEHCRINRYLYRCMVPGTGDTAVPWVQQLRLGPAKVGADHKTTSVRTVQAEVRLTGSWGSFGAADQTCSKGVQLSTPYCNAVAET